VIVWWFLLACSGATTTDSAETEDTATATMTDTGTGDGLPRADVIDVTATGEEQDWLFDVSLLSDDEGCDHYADWWEVVGEDGTLLFRRILRHSHVDEQPFTRDGGPVTIAGDQLVWVRGHQNDRGYGGSTMTGTVLGGFETADWPAGLGTGLEDQEPQPEPCLY